MPQKIEAPGTYLGTIMESGINVTKNGIPQWVARLRADKRFIESPADIAWYQEHKKLLTDGKAAYVDWLEADEDILAYLTLYSFKNAQEISPDTETLNAKQLNLATGWAAPDFESLGALVGKPILFRVEFRSYTSPEGKTTEGNQVTWIDSPEASPQRQLRTLDQGGVKDLMAKVVGYGKTSKPASAASVATLRPPTPTAASVPSAPTSSTPPAATSPTATKPPTKRATKKADATPPATNAFVAPGATPFPDPPKPANTTQIDAWNFVNANKATADDSDVEKCWMESTTAVLGDSDEAKATGEQWAKVRDLTVEKLSSLVPF